MTPIKIVLADDHVLIREGFKSMLDKDEQFVVTGEAADGNELVLLLQESDPDIVLLDITMPVLNGLQVLEQIHASRPMIKFIVLSMHEEREYILRAIRSGASGYLLKNVDKEELKRAMKVVFGGEKYFSPAISSTLADAVGQPALHTVTDITPREKEVLTLVADGSSSKQIADKLNISVRTVETHRINLLRKYQATNTADLISKHLHEGF